MTRISDKPLAFQALQQRRREQEQRVRDRLRIFLEQKRLEERFRLEQQKFATRERLAREAATS